MNNVITKFKETVIKVVKFISNKIKTLMRLIEKFIGFIGNKIVVFARLIKKTYMSDKLSGLRLVIYYITLAFILVWIYKLIDGFVKRRWHNATFIQKRAITGYLFISPWIIGFLALVLYPFGKVVFMSFNIVNQYQQDYTYKWIGWDNFHRVLFVDIDFVIELQNFIVRVLLYSPVIIAISIIIAMLLNQKIRGKGIFRMIFFLPIIILNGALLENMSDYGGMDIQLSFFVLDVLSTVIPNFALGLFVGLFEILIEILWYCGVPILIFLAMLQKVDKSLYEAASIDGANSWSIFWKIVLPAIYPAISVSIIFIVVFLANFDGNPLNNMIFVARNEPSQKEGYASAMALVYASVQMVIIALLFMLTRDKSSKKGRV